MSTRNTAKEWAEQNSPPMRDLLQRIRRFAVTLTSGALWQVVGHLMPDGRKEARAAEVFSGIGFYGRPADGHRPEAIVLFPGGAPNPVVVAARDEDTRKIAAADLGPDSAAMFSTGAIVRIEGGSIQARSVTGTAQPVLNQDDGTRILSALTAAIGAETAAGHGAGAAALQAFKDALTATGFPSCTEIFSAE